jgi:hypothetical protein
MAKLFAGAGALVDNDGCAVGCAGVPSLRCVCFTPTKANAPISSTARTTPVATWGSCGRYRYRLDDRTPPLPLTFNTFTGYDANRTWGPNCRQCHGAVNLGQIWLKLPTMYRRATGVSGATDE